MISSTLSQVYRLSEAQGLPTPQAARKIAEDRLKAARP